MTTKPDAKARMRRWRNVMCPESKPDAAIRAIDAFEDELDDVPSLVERIRALDRRIEGLLAEVLDVPYVVFHDAYQGFENHYGLRPVAAIAESSAKMPGTRRVLAIRRQLSEAGVRCVFSESRYQTRLLDALTDGLDVRHGVLDPLGGEPTPGVNGWLELMWRLATNLHSCLSAAPVGSQEKVTDVGAALQLTAARRYREPTNNRPYPR